MTTAPSPAPASPRFLPASASGCSIFVLISEAAADGSPLAISAHRTFTDARIARLAFYRESYGMLGISPHARTTLSIQEVDSSSINIVDATTEDIIDTLTIQAVEIA